MFETLEAIGKGARAPPAAAGEAEGETQAPRMSGGLWVAGRGEPRGLARGLFRKAAASSLFKMGTFDR